MKYIFAAGMLIFTLTGQASYKRVCSLECYNVEPLKEYQTCMKNCTDSEQREEALDKEPAKPQKPSKPKRNNK
ncbi:MAG TPA: hypothetical protein VNJ08_14040 [Bacteriovoracaceae bacterium]|nr:hypothetical protein [Bacteriovoracaceae bacterium]